MATIGFTVPGVAVPLGAAVHGVAVTKSDSTVYNPPLRMLWVGGTGDVAVTLLGDTTAVTLSAVPAGTLLNVCVSKVMSTNTSATLPLGDPVHALAVTKSDATIYSPPLQMLQIGGAGDVSVILLGDTTPVTLSAVRAGTVLNVCVRQVMATNTTATLITGLY